MKSLTLLLLVFVSFVAHAEELKSLSSEDLEAKVVEVTNAQNKMMMRGSTVADIDSLFDLYTEDFVYIHKVYGGTYTRDELYGNSVKALNRGSYDFTEPRYRIVSMIPGYNGIAVERQENWKGRIANHLAVFEFRGYKVSKIIEYWK